MGIEEKVRSLRMRIRFHLNRMQAEQADAEILEFAREIQRATMERSGAVGDIAAERARQVEKWGNAHDDEHDGMELICAAIVYSAHALHREGQIHGEDRDEIESSLWSWSDDYLPSHSESTDQLLIRAGALIAAELDRRKRSIIPAEPKEESDEG